MASLWRFMPLMTNDAYSNMAIDEALFKAKIYNPALPNTVRFYCWNPSAVSIGKHQDLNTEVDVEKSKELGIDIVRRISGGGAVFHDSRGEITYSIVMSRRDFEKDSPKNIYQSVLKSISHACAKLDIKTEYGQIQCPALFVDGKKISGNAQAVHKDVILQHGTILLDYNPYLMYSVLNARPDKPRIKMIESVFAYVTTLSKIIGYTITPKTFSKHLKTGFQSVFKIKHWESAFLTKLESLYVEQVMNHPLKREACLRHVFQKSIPPMSEDMGILDQTS